MAENISENARSLARFRRAERERSGTKRLRRGQEIPVAVLVQRVNLKTLRPQPCGAGRACLTAAIRKAMSKV